MRRAQVWRVTPVPYLRSMFAAVTSVALVGVEPVPVRVEVHVGGGKQIFSLVGLPDTAIREAKERVRSAILSSGFHFPTRRVTVNLAPADIPKAGSAYDLPIALGVLAAHGSIPAGASRVVALGELALDGRLRKPRGSLGAAMVASDAGVPCVVPSAAVGEASIAPGADIRGAANLAEAVGVALGEIPPSAGPAADAAPCHDRVADLSAVRGQMLARRALEIAAAGGHHLLLSGPPGAGCRVPARRCWHDAYRGSCRLCPIAMLSRRRRHGRQLVGCARIFTVRRSATRTTRQLLLR